MSNKKVEDIAKHIATPNKNIPRSLILEFIPCVLLVFDKFPVRKTKPPNSQLLYNITVPFAREIEALILPYLTRNKKKPNPYEIVFFLLGGAEPRLNSADNLREFITFLPKNEIKIPNPTFRVFIIGRKVLNYCGIFGSEG